MLVLTMNFDEPVTLYADDGTFLGQIKIVNSSFGKAKIAFDMCDKVAVARVGISKDTAISLLNKKKNICHGAKSK